ncbi:transcriptional regulator with XRE-family HTH domain [Bosea sp. BE125]|uniref:helix-turn-helix domain-containing protein n=1 Tax=Bosea sp. BE125 TaxID=2817909 RepID=UPI002864D427|nr:helix-turn-helix transcriptional regulator [Bosea sp. BE125]MDR6873583.1 transcriptional regulator with XRE-family HTH domain [Bosea sp. BE125]
MSYLGEDVISALHEARQAAGLSQRALSGKAGLSQSHISQIESGMLEPGLSKLIQIARALDLELMLVPRKMVPAIKNITASSGPERESPTFALKEIERAERILKKQLALHGTSVSLDRAFEALRFFRHAPVTPADVKAISDGADHLKHNRDSRYSAQILHSLAYEWMLRRNRLAHGVSEEPRPAYASDEDDDA